MEQLAAKFKSGNQLSARSKLIWRIVQVLVWFTGAFIFFCLIFYPSLGITLFWNMLIPVAPALIAVAVGLWRNVCPLATTNLLPRKLGFSQRNIMPVQTQAKLSLIAVIALFVIVPLRHPVFNNSGIATAAIIFLLIITGMLMSFIYEWKSGWCSSLCPIHPVEKMYGGNVIGTLPNAHCGNCMNCVVPCPDSTPNVHPRVADKIIYHKLSGALLVGGLPGFIWGWFHVPDKIGISSFHDLLIVYMIPFTGLLVTLLLYLLLNAVLKNIPQRKLINLFAAAAISCYYWYRLPELFGIGIFPGDGLLADLSSVLPAWTVYIFNTVTTVFFFWWIIIRKRNKKSWVVRPEYELKASGKLFRHSA
jgi:hypothetical protein